MPRAAPRRFVVLGANGQLGTDLCAALARAFPQAELIALTRRELDVTNTVDTQARICAERPDVVINATAYVRVDDCEEDLLGCFSVNTFAAAALARSACSIDARFVHFSTDYVFGGDSGRSQPYGEEDRPSPINAYGTSKLAGEHLVLAIDPHALVIRTCGLYGAAGASSKAGNFVETMLRKARNNESLAVVDDQRNTPSYTADVADKAAELVGVGAEGMFHVTNSGECSWYEFARAILDYTGLPADLRPTTSAQIVRRARRPTYSVMANQRLRTAGLAPLRSWPEALATYLTRRGHVAGPPASI